MCVRPVLGRGVIIYGLVFNFHGWRWKPPTLDARCGTKLYVRNRRSSTHGWSSYQVQQVRTVELRSQKLMYVLVGKDTYQVRLTPYANVAHACIKYGTGASVKHRCEFPTKYIWRFWKTNRTCGALQPTPTPTSNLQGGNQLDRYKAKQAPNVPHTNT